MSNSRNLFAKGYKAPVTKENLSLWLKHCDKVLLYLLSLKDQRQKLLIEGHNKTVICGYTFSIHSLVSIAQEYLSCECCPLQYILTYKFSQDHLNYCSMKFAVHVDGTTTQMFYSSCMHWECFS